MVCLSLIDVVIFAAVRTQVPPADADLDCDRERDVLWDLARITTTAKYSVSQLR
jgi:hypothetical protein